MKIKVGITGQSGFIGTNLYNYLSLFKSQIDLVDWDDKYFESIDLLKEFVNACDVIVHLAAVNRHFDENLIFNTNVNLVEKLIEALSLSNKKKLVIYSSSTQEKLDNPYGKSKLIGRKKLVEWARKTNNGFIGLIIPNVFGPFGKPFYNSAIATFSYQIINGEEPKIIQDNELKLIYVQELVNVIYNNIYQNFNTIIEEYNVEHTYTAKVSNILNKLFEFHRDYIINNTIPKITNNFELNLFNTFRSFIDLNKFYPVKLKMNIDARGNFTELIKSSSTGQVSYSTTYPKITRGNHFHTRKIERFIVIKGKAKIKLRRFNSDEIFEFNLDGDEPSFVDMPIWYTHNITNIGEEDLITIFWINEFYNPEDPDTYYEEV